jgi:hypothetical protein
MTWRIRVTLLSPACFNQKRGVGNVLPSLDYIPGATLRGALAGWETVGPELQEQLDALIEEQQDAARRHLAKVAGRLRTARFVTAASEVERYLEPAVIQGELLESQKTTLHFWLARAFLGSLYQLYRGKDVLREASAPGRPYCRSLEEGP